MADINIEKDKSKQGGGGSKIWLWVIGILVLAGIIWWIAAILFPYFSKTDFIAIDMDGKPRKTLRGGI